MWVLISIYFGTHQNHVEAIVEAILMNGIYFIADWIKVREGHL